MKKNKMMRAASALLVAVLLTTCVISGTYAKYTTSNSASDSARVAKWGFNSPATITFDLFDDVYETNKVDSDDDKNVIAPGTTKSATFAFTYNATTKPEVMYKINVDASESTCDSAIKSNPNIVWQLNGGTFGTWDQLIAAIEELDGGTTPGSPRRKKPRADFLNGGLLWRLSPMDR